jgi:UDP-N-acetylglucosamine 2-epimerase (non-hydrolysing)
VELGTNVIVGDDLDLAGRMVEQILRGEWKKGSVPPLWDGHAASRVVDVLLGAAARRMKAAS